MSKRMLFQSTKADDYRQMRSRLLNRARLAREAFNYFAVKAAQNQMHTLRVAAHNGDWIPGF